MNNDKPKRQSHLAAFKAEIREWKRLTAEEEVLIRIFCSCVAMRMRGEDPAEVLKLKQGRQ